MPFNKLPMVSPQPEENFTDSSVPLFCEPFTAWRVWNILVDGDKVKLTSITHKVKWPYRKPMRAHCIHQWARLILPSFTDSYGKHTAPSIKHGCGIHSLRKRKDLKSWDMGSQSAFLRLAGEVNIWGKTLCYTEGYTSEFAYPKSIYVETDRWDKMAVSHQLDITPHELMDALVESYGITVVVE